MKELDWPETVPWFTAAMCKDTFPGNWVARQFPKSDVMFQHVILRLLQPMYLVAAWPNGAVNWTESTPQQRASTANYVFSLLGYTEDC